MKQQGKTTRSEVLSLAWEMKKDGTAPTFGEAQKQAWAVIKAQKAMRSEVVVFAFKKENGETRRAVGTLDQTRFQWTAKGQGETKGSRAVVKYFDLESNGWRAFRAERFLGLAA